MGSSNSVPSNQAVLVEHKGFVQIKAELVDQHLRKQSELEQMLNDKEREIRAHQSRCASLESELRNRSNLYDGLDQTTRRLRYEVAHALVQRDAANANLTSETAKLQELQSRFNNLRIKQNLFEDKRSRIEKTSAAELWAEKESVNALSTKLEENQRQSSAQMLELNRVRNMLRRERQQHDALKSEQENYNLLQIKYDNLFSELLNLRKLRMVEVYNALSELKKQASNVSEKILEKIKANTISQPKQLHDSTTKCKTMNINEIFNENYENASCNVRKPDDQHFQHVLKRVQEISLKCEIMFNQLMVSLPKEFLKSAEKYSNTLNYLEAATIEDCVGKEENLNDEQLKKFDEKKLLETDRDDTKQCNIDFVNNLEKNSNLENDHSIIIFNLYEDEDRHLDTKTIEIYLELLSGTKIPSKNIHRMGQPRDRPRPVKVTLIRAEDMELILRQSKITHYRNVNVDRFILNHSSILKANNLPGKSMVVYNSKNKGVTLDANR